MNPETPRNVSVPTLPKGGGAIQGIGEKFQPNVFDGTGSFSVPIPLTDGRGGFGPKLALQYSSGSGSSVYGLGWSLGLPRVARKTDKGLPTYSNEDVFVLSGAEDLVPLAAGSPMITRQSNPAGFEIQAYRPRTEGLFACIELWTDIRTSAREQHWRVMTKDNVTSLYGISANVRIADPADPQRVSEWLIAETFDAKGNHILYRYASDAAPASVPEDSDLMVEEGDAFTAKPRSSAQRYLRRILYGNAPNGMTEGATGTCSDPSDPRKTVTRRYAFEAVFDYGDWDLDRDLTKLSIAPGTYRPMPTTEVITGPMRTDAFSSFRSGFEVRTRLHCERVLMYHHIGASLSMPVKAVSFRHAYAEGSGLALLTGVTIAGYREQGGTLVQRTLPEITFDYNGFKPGEQRFVTMTARDDEMPPLSLDHPEFALVDVFGEALPAFVHSTPGIFRVWRNLGGGRFERPQPLPAVPAGLSLAMAGVGFADTDGDGLLEMKVQTDLIRASFELNADLSWKEARYLENIPVADGRDPNARAIDLTGDGLPDLLITRDHHWLWYENRGADGYTLRDPVERETMDEHLRDIYFNDSAGRIRLADMTGDGLLDIVRVHWGTVEYWPNLGQGRFGQRVIMGTVPGSPALDSDFDPARLFLVDLDGSGCADLVYVRDNRVEFWFNRCGNTWSERRTIHGTPVAPNGAGIQFADVFGTGTATLVWSRDLGSIPGGSYFALDFCGGVKPHLLVGMDNGLGAETRVTHTPSTEFLQRDREQDITWHTQLPFPVHVIGKVEVTDRVSRCRHTTEYRYRHGFYDGKEREFRGFAYVEQTDTEVFNLFKDGTVENSQAANINEALHLPPVVTKTWFHTGAWIESFSLADKLREEFWDGDAVATALPDHEVPADAEAFRALRGAVLRSEVYALDSDPLNAVGSKAALPFSVTESRYRVTEVQPRGGNQHGVFYTTTAESLTHHYERNPADPRVSHELQEVPDAFGNITRKVAIAYPRRAAPGHLPEQSAVHVVETTADIINDPHADGAWWIGVPFQSRSFEVSAAPPVAGVLFTLADFASSTRRLLNWSRTYFRKDSAAASTDASGRLPLGVIDSLGLPHDTLQAAFPDALVSAAYAGRANSDAMRHAGYVRETDVADHWWLPSGRAAFDPSRFCLPISTDDPFGNRSRITYDGTALLAESHTDPLGNVVRVTNDYRVMQPKAVVSPNGHVSEAAFDALGRVVATAVRSKDGTEGDDLGGVEADLRPDQIADFLADPRGRAAALLGHATTRMVYDLHAAPVLHATIARTEHHSVNQNPDVLLTFSYSDGFGRAAQTKVQAEPDQNGAERWARSGWTVFNNKGKPVRQFEPAFSASHEFEFDARHGVSPYLFYDPLGRVIATLKPDHTWEKVVFDPWQQTTHDAQDNVLVTNPRTDPDVGHFFKKLPKAEWLPTWHQQMRANGSARDRDAAAKAAAHASTPSVVHLDVIARPVLAIGDLGNGSKLATKTSYDILSNVLTITDPRDIVAFTHTFDLLKRQITVNSVDAGASWLLPDVLNAPSLSGDANGNTVLALYDELRRPTERWLLPPGASVWQLTLKTLYGEASANAGANLRGQVWKVYDGAGLQENEQFDFKAGLRKASRTLWHDPHTQPVWGTSGDPRSYRFNEASAQRKLDTEHRYTATSTCDALNRVVTSTSPDDSVQRFVFNEASLLDAVHVKHRGGAEQTIVTNIDYNARGQRERIVYGNGVVTSYKYDDRTFRLIHLTSRRQASAGSDPVLQDISYTYDAAGNITCIRDEAHDRIFYGSQGTQFITEPEMRYQYDALSRLVKATGREHEAFGPCHYQHGDQQQAEFLPVPQPASNAQAIVPYTQQYQYDDGGNLFEIRHLRGGRTRWVRAQTYATDSNRILASGSACDSTQSALAHDANGNFTNLQHLPALQWNDRNQLIGAQLNVAAANPDGAVYHYDAAGQRVRKVIRRGSLIEERVYLGGFEIFIMRNGSGISERWETLHLSDGTKRIALIETKTSSNGATVLDKLIRFQLSNHLDSAVVEVDDSPQARVISYEEFTPYGETAYIAGTNQIEVSRKRYRYSGGKERDNESGLYYYGARYLAPWMGRWVSCDPAAPITGQNSFIAFKNNPILYVDPQGMADTQAAQTKTPQPKIYVDNNGLTQVEGFVRSDKYNKTEFTPAEGSPWKGFASIQSNWDYSDGTTFKGSSYEIRVEGDALHGRGFANIIRAEHLAKQVQGLDVAGFDLDFTHESTVNAVKVGSDFAETWGGKHLSFMFRANGFEINWSEVTVVEMGDRIWVAGKATRSAPGAVAPVVSVAAMTAASVGAAATQATPPSGIPVAGFSRSAFQLEQTLLSRAANFVVGAGGSFLGGYSIGEGIMEGGATGANKAGFAATNLTVTLGGGKAVEAGALLAGGGSWAVAGYGMLMCGSLILAEQSIDAALHGEPTPIDVAGDYWVNYFLE